MGLVLQEDTVLTGQEILDLLSKNQWGSKKEEDIYGVYLIRNTKNSKTYVGSTSGRTDGIKGRWYDHVYGCKTGTHHNTHLVRSWNKYGASAFEFSVIEKIDNNFDTFDEYDTFVRSREQYFFQVYNCFDNGYNLAKYATGGSGRILSELIKEDKSKSISKEQYYIVIDKLCNTDQSIRSIAQELKINSSIVSEIYKKHIIIDDAKEEDYIFQKRGSFYNKLSEEEIKDIILRYQNGESTYDIGKDYCRVNGVIIDLLRKNNINIPVANKGLDYQNKREGIGIKVYQYDLTGKYIQSFENCTQAALYISQGKMQDNTNINACCLGKLQQSYGYIWKYYYAEQLQDIDIIQQILEVPMHKQHNPIIQYDLDWNPLKIYKSVRSVTNDNTYQTISRNIKLNLHDTETFGYKWKYAKDADYEDLKKLLYMKEHKIHPSCELKKIKK